MQEHTEQRGAAESPQEGGAPLPYEMRSLGYPRSRKNEGHSEAALPSHERSPALRGDDAEFMN